MLRRPFIAPLLATALALGPLPTGHAETRIHERPVQSVFHIEKSENNNQVHYGVRVDEQCRPRGNTPMYAYWKDLEEGPNVTNPLLKHELPAYGLSNPRSITRGDTGGEVRIGLRGFPDRDIVVETFRGETRCRARAFTDIKKQRSLLASIYVEIGFLFSVDYVILKGFRLPDGSPVKEKIDD